jgi:hypothetical protein
MTKKKIIIIIIVLLIILFVPYRKSMLWDGGSVEYRSVLCKYTKVHKYTENYDGAIEGLQIEILGIKVFDNTKVGKVSILYACDTTPNGVNTIITEYFTDDKHDASNMAYWYVDETNSKVIVGMIDVSEEKQDEFINSVFASCGTAYVKLIYSRRLIEFQESKGVFTGEIIEFKNNSLLVKILNEEVGTIGSDKVYVQGKDINN